MKKIATAIAVSTLATTGVDAMEEKQRLAPPAVYDVAPGMGHFTDDALYGDVWNRPELSPRDRSLVTLAALISTGKTAQIGGHVGRALDNGASPSEIGEIITQLAFYSGWPNAVSAAAETKRVFEQRNIGPVIDSKAPRAHLEEGAEAARAETVNAAVRPTAPALAELTNKTLFGDLWRRPDLSPRDRSLVTMAALVAIGQPEQLPFHANRAMDNGLTRVEASEMLAHLGFYAGWPRAMSAVPTLQRVFAARESSASEEKAPAANGVQIHRAGPGATGSEANFTGAVAISTLYQGSPPARISGGTVSFAAGARTAWHTHPLGQTLFIVSGKAWVQKEGEAIEVAGPNDVVWIPPMVKHWHGASPDAPMTHFAIAELLNGGAVVWMEKVSDEAYLAGPMNGR